MYPTITCSSSLPQGVRYVTSDSGYDDHNLYSLSIGRRGFELVCPVSEIYNYTPSDRLQLIESWRSISVEPLIEHIKEVFRIDPLPVRRHQQAAAIVLLSVLIYQIMVYYNCKTGNKQTTKSDNTHARKLIKQKINLKREIQIMPQPQLFTFFISSVFDIIFVAFFDLFIIS